MNNTIRETPAAALMRAAQDAPDRAQARIQVWLDGPTLEAIDAAGARMVPPMSRAEFHRAAIREKLERENNRQHGRE